MPQQTYQTQFDALVQALIKQEWGKGYLLLIELKNLLESTPFAGFVIQGEHADFMEQEFSFSTEELRCSQDIVRALEAFLEDQAGLDPQP